MVIELNISTVLTKNVKTVTVTKMQVVVFALAPLTRLSEPTIRQNDILA